MSREKITTIIKTEYKTLNKKFKKLIVKKMPAACRLETRTEDYKKIHIIKDSNSKILGWAEKEGDSYKLVINIERNNFKLK